VPVPVPVHVHVHVHVHVCVCVVCVCVCVCKGVATLCECECPPPSASLHHVSRPWQGTEKLDNLANAIKEARREAQPKSVVSMLWKKPSVAFAVSGRSAFAMASLLEGDRERSPSRADELTSKSAPARWKMATSGTLKMARSAKAEPAPASPDSKRPTSVFSVANDLASSMRSSRSKRPGAARPSTEMASSTDAASSADRQGSTDRV
jgi:hypothetical protein